MISYFPFHIGRATLLRSVVVCTLVVAATMLYLWQHMVMVDQGYRIERSRLELAHLSHQRTELLVEVARLSSLGRIEQMARTQLGMSAPRPEQLVRVIPAAKPGQGAQQGANSPLLLAATTP